MEKSSFDNVNSSQVNIDHAFKAALKAVEAGNSLLLSYFGRIKHIEEKDQAAGLVSEADRECENLMKKILAEECPDFDFLGEETAYLENNSSFSTSQKPRWILDPLDGTTNFVHRFPIFCISLALEVNHEIQLGIVDMPMLKQRFTAQKNQGAFCNGEKIFVSKTEKLEQAFMSTGFVAESQEVLKEQLKIFEHFVWKARAIRRPGAAAYDLALIASGVFDLYWEKNLKPWDSAAGLLLVQEAGGVVKTFENEAYHPFKKSLIAGPKATVELFQKELSQLLAK